MHDRSGKDYKKFGVITPALQTERESAGRAVVQDLAKQVYERFAEALADFTREYQARERCVLKIQYVVPGTHIDHRVDCRIGQHDAPDSRVLWVGLHTVEIALRVYSRRLLQWKFPPRVQCSL